MDPRTELLSFSPTCSPSVLAEFWITLPQRLVTVPGPIKLRFNPIYGQPLAASSYQAKRQNGESASQLAKWADLRGFPGGWFVKGCPRFPLIDHALEGSLQEQEALIREWMAHQQLFCLIVHGLQLGLGRPLAMDSGTFRMAWVEQYENFIDGGRYDDPLLRTLLADGWLPLVANGYSYDASAYDCQHHFFPRHFFDPFISVSGLCAWTLEGQNEARFQAAARWFLTWYCASTTGWRNFSDQEAVERLAARCEFSLPALVSGPTSQVVRKERIYATLNRPACSSSTSLRKVRKFKSLKRRLEALQPFPQLYS